MAVGDAQRLRTTRGSFWRYSWRREEKGTGYQCSVPVRKVRVVGYRRALAGGVKYKGWLQGAVDGMELGAPSVVVVTGEPLFPLALGLGTSHSLRHLLPTPALVM